MFVVVAALCAGTVLTRLLLFFLRMIQVVGRSVMVHSYMGSDSQRHMILKQRRGLEKTERTKVS